MSRPGASGREEGTPCRSRTFCQGPCASYPWQFVLRVKRGEIRSVMIGWERLVELHPFFPQCWCHQIQQSCPTFRIPKKVGSGVGTKAGIPSQVTGRSLLSQLYPASSLCQGIFQVCFPLAYKDRQGSFLLFWEKKSLDLKLFKSLFLCRPTIINCIFCCFQQILT